MMAGACTTKGWIWRFHDMRHIALTFLLAAFVSSCSSRTSRQTEAVRLSSQSDAREAAAESSVGDSILSQTIYAPRDSARVVELLRMPIRGNDVLFYARQFIGVPYVASTLERADPERLVVNLRQLDCTTLVETSLALALTKRQGGKTFADYCLNLMRLRYWGGRMDGYLSRLHYFTWWMHDNMDKGLVEEVTDPKYFAAVINVDNHYMSAHPEKYRFLKGRKDRIDAIKRLEQKYNGPDGRYLPAASTDLPKDKIGVVHDGDIIAIVTSKDGIDYSHLGFAMWGKEGKLHLLNASSIHHKVVEEPMTLRQYLRKHPSSIGIRVLRLR